MWLGPLASVHAHLTLSLFLSLSRTNRYKTHEPAGKGKLWQPKDAAREPGPLRATKPDLPVGFLTSIYERHLGAQYVDYLPYVPNLNKARSLGAVMPRQIMEDWTATGYDPWCVLCVCVCVSRR